MVTQVESSPPSSSLDHVEKTKTLICALNLLSRNLPLPPDVFATVSSIYHGADDADSSSDASQLLDDSSKVRLLLTPPFGQSGLSLIWDFELV